jgi:hypothetical protein
MNNLPINIAFTCDVKSCAARVIYRQLPACGDSLPTPGLDYPGCKRLTMPLPCVRVTGFRHRLRGDQKQPEE